MPGELWREIGDTMRELRKAHGVSLRQLEESSRWRRGTLSQVETGKLRPSPELVDFYEHRFDADGLLLALYQQARATTLDHQFPSSTRDERLVPGDAIEVLECSVPSGALVEPGQDLVVVWRLRNAGVVPWRGRGLARLGAAGGTRLIRSEPCVNVPATEPGHAAEVGCEVAAPLMPGAVVAYWRMAREDGSYCFAAAQTLGVLLKVL